MAKKLVNILIIDDNPMMRRLFGGKLQEHGYEVLYSADPMDGREVARRMNPALILLDVNMPGDVDGFALAQRLRDEPETKDIPIVFLTNQDLTTTAQQTLVQTLNAGYVHKSAPTEELIKVVKEYLHKKIQK